MLESLATVELPVLSAWIGSRHIPSGKSKLMPLFRSEKRMSLTRANKTALLAMTTLLTAAGAADAQSGSEFWQEISAVKDRKTHMAPQTWTLDKYPKAPTLEPHSKIALLDQEGSGVVTLFHVSDYAGGDDSQLILRIWYDNEQEPSIEMPLMDFLGDIQSATAPYFTIHFSHVRRSHNFRLPMPFRKHIRIEVENPTDTYLMGYMELQWDEVQEIPKQCGYLRVSYRAGDLAFPHEDLILCDIQSPGAIVAHWLQLEGDHPSCDDGQGICEGNHEIYLDGDTEPTYESLGVEDFYGHSWGFPGTETDSYAAIVRAEQTAKGGTLAAMVRARSTDKITFRKSCKIRLTYKHDLGEPYHPATRKGKAPALQPFVDGTSIKVPYRSCIYYYAKD
jgi:hypothetical protein